MKITSSDRKLKEVDSDLMVNVWTPKGFLAAGDLNLDEDGDEIAATFKYADSYIEHPDAFALDPINMPLGKTKFATVSQFVQLGAIFDAAPDAWGRRVVQAQLSQDVQRRVFRGAFLRGADGIGSLVLTPKVLSPGMDLQSIVELSLNERPGISQLARAASAAAQFEQGDDLTDDLKDMLGGSWTIGGARPKAILRRDDGKGLHGESLIAKFQSKNDTIERNRLEYASLRMATEMGMPAAGHHLQELDGGGTALILERFDRCVVSNEIQRLHYVSAMSLASHQPQSKMLNSRMDQVMLSWSKLLELSSRVAERPAQARVQMFARLCLNTALQNTDDHLKNFGFLKRPGADHYELAPVFDVSPQGAQRHYLYCHDQGQVYSLQDVIKCARALGIAKAAAAEVEEAIVQVLHRSSEFFDEAGMNEADQDKANAWISSGLGARYAQREAAGQSVTIERPA